MSPQFVIISSEQDEIFYTFLFVVGGFGGFNFIYLFFKTALGYHILPSGYWIALVLGFWLLAK